MSQETPAQPLSYQEQLDAFAATYALGGLPALNDLVGSTSLRHFPCPCGRPPGSPMETAGFMGARTRPDIAARRCALCFGAGMVWASEQAKGGVWVLYNGGTREAWERERSREQAAFELEALIVASERRR